MEDESSVVMEPMVDFWGVELSGKQRKLQWPRSEEELDPDVTNRLELRQACLGAKAKEGERNVVEMTADDENGQEVTHTIISLCVGRTEQSPLFLEVFPPVVFNLVSGSGPLHIVGSVHTELGAMSSDEEEDDSLTSPELIKTRKRAAESPPTKAAKAMKLAVASKVNGEEMETSREQDEEEEEEEEESDEEDSEEESEEESEKESDEEEEAVEEKATKKTPLKPALVSKLKAKSAQKPAQMEKQKSQFKTPQPPKGAKTSGKVTLSAPTTPEHGKAAKKMAKLSMSMEDMKEKLKKTPNLPRKLDKFSNYVHHNFKVTDDKVKKQLWEFAQKVRVGK